MKRTSRLPSNLSESLHRRLNSYALAATAAGVGALAFALPAEGKIIYTRTNHQIDKSHHSYSIYFTHDHEIRNAEIRFRSSSSMGSSRKVIYATGAIVYATQDRTDVALALKPGSRIGPSRHFNDPPREDIMAEVSVGQTQRSRGYWFNVSDRYLGLEFKINGKNHFGWARLSAGGGAGIATLTGYAYETVPNKPIVAGKTHGKDVITVTEPAGLGALAAGASRKGIQ